MTGDEQREDKVSKPESDNRLRLTFSIPKIDSTTSPFHALSGAVGRIKNNGADAELTADPKDEYTLLLKVSEVWKDRVIKILVQDCEFILVK